MWRRWHPVRLWQLLQELWEVTCSENTVIGTLSPLKFTGSACWVFTLPIDGFQSALSPSISSEVYFMEFEVMAGSIYIRTRLPPFNFVLTFTWIETISVRPQLKGPLIFCNILDLFCGQADWSNPCGPFHFSGSMDYFGGGSSILQAVLSPHSSLQEERLYRFFISWFVSQPWISWDFEFLSRGSPPSILSFQKLIEVLFRID